MQSAAPIYQAKIVPLLMKNYVFVCNVAINHIQLLLFFRFDAHWLLVTTV